MEYDINRIRCLCDRYFNADISDEDEALLRSFFLSSADIPDDLMAVKLMICGFEAAASMTYTPVSSEKKSQSVFRRIVWGTMAAAASIMICITVFNREIYGYDADGRPITDPQVALRSTECLAMLDRLETTIDIAELLAKKMENNN